nr:unnamed protein product [Callosobruchus chinensis]
MVSEKFQYKINATTGSSFIVPAVEETTSELPPSWLCTKPPPGMERSLARRRPRVKPKAKKKGFKAPAIAKPKAAPKQ